MEPIYKLYSSLTELEQQKTWAEIDLDALRQNYRLVRRIVSGGDTSPRIVAVVKAEAYGHGAPACVHALLAEGCDFFAVSCIDEAVAVREVCDGEGKLADVLVLGYTTPAHAAQLAQRNIIQTLLSEDYATRLEEAAALAGVTVRVHAALDTGMNRIGFAVHSDGEVAASVSALLRVGRFPHLSVEGAFTHFSRADEEPFGDGEARTEEQALRFRQVISSLEERGMRIPFLHLCNSAATCRYPSEHMSGVRVGILLYGARPSEHVGLSLRPVMKLKTVISHIHKLLPGEAVSYGGTFTADSERLIATLPIGYADGFMRAYSGATVTVSTQSGDRAVPIVGRICMDQCMIDVTDTGADVGDVVTLFGNHPEELAALASRAATTDYEALCLISSRVTRVYQE